MTAGVVVGFEAAGGGQVDAASKKVADGILKIAGASQKAAAAARAHGKAMQDANAHGYKSAHARGDHGGFMHGLHIAGAAGGEVGHLGHKFARAGRFGAGGLAAAGAGMVGAAMVESMEFFSERMAEVFKKAAELSASLRAAGRKVGETGLAFADGHGLALSRLGSGGANFDDIKRAGGMGIGPEGLADLWDSKNRDQGIKAASAARRYGMDPNAAAKAIGQAGGVNDGADPNQVGAYYAGISQNRRISSDEIARGAEGGGEVGGRMAVLDALSDRTKGVGLSAVEDGKAASAAATKLNGALNPEAAAMTEAWKKATEESEVLNKIAEHTSWLQKLVQNFTDHKGSAEVQAIRATQDNATVLNMQTIGAGD